MHKEPLFRDRLGGCQNDRRLIRPMATAQGASGEPHGLAPWLSHPLR
jgi:hypothetical protein